MDLLLWIGLFLASLIGLVYSADKFTESAEKIGIALGLSSFIVGATIVSIGSSMPEIATSLMAVFSGDPNALNFPIENIIGSNIANCLLVGGVAAIAVGTLKVKERLIDVDLPFFFISSSLFLLFIIDGAFDWKEGIVSMLLLILFITYTISESDDEEKKEKKERITPGTLAWLVTSIVGIYFSSDYTIESIQHISALLNIESAVLTMIVVAIGTSLPELVVSVRAALAGKHSVALGNIFGSNTFNVLAVAGIPSFFGTLTVSETAAKIGIPFFIVASLGFIFTTTDDKIKKWEGFALLVIYIAFCGKLVGVL